jgi:hypothetical protein
MNQMQLRQQMTVWENKQRVFSKVFNERATWNYRLTENKLQAEPGREVSDPARFWGVAQAVSEGRTKYWMQPDVKSTSHQDKGTPVCQPARGNRPGIKAEQE